MADGLATRRRGAAPRDATWRGTSGGFVLRLSPRPMGCVLPKWVWCLPSLAGLLLASSATASEAKQSVHLQYEVEPALRGCPSTSDFRAVVARKLGYDPHTTDAPLHVEVRLASSQEGLSGTVEWRRAGGTPLGKRRFSAQRGNCRDLASMMGFVVAVQLQMMTGETAPAVQPAGSGRPSPLADESPPTAEPDNRSGAPRSGFETPRAHPEDSRAPPTSPALLAGSGPSVGLGVGPEPTLQGRLFLALVQQGRALELGALASLPATAERSSAGFRYQAILGTLAACSRAAPLLGCGLANLGTFRVHGVRVDRPATPQGFIAQAGLRLGYELGLGRSVTGMAHLDGLYLLTPWTVELNHQKAWSMPRLSAALGLDLALHLPFP